MAYFPQDFGLSEPSQKWFRFVWSVNSGVIATLRLRFGDDLDYREASGARLGSRVLERAYEHADKA